VKSSGIISGVRGGHRISPNYAYCFLSNIGHFSNDIIFSPRHQCGENGIAK
jgi:hypothetical protein